MHEQSPWKTPFGKLLIGSSLVALVVGFSLAAGVSGYFRTEPASAEDNLSAPTDYNATEIAAGDFVEPSETATESTDVLADPNGYAAALAELPTAGGSTEASPSPPTTSEDGSLPTDTNEPANSTGHSPTEGYRP